MKYNYAFKSDKENVVKVVGRDMGISAKQSIEICSFIKNMRLEKAKALLERVTKKQVAIPFKRFTEGAGHKKGMSGGKYPLTASEQFLKLLKALEANAQNKGLSSELKIIHACAQRASRPLHYGRKRGIKMKRTHVELAAEEIEHVKKEVKKEIKKEETKKEVKEAETKKEAKETVKKEEKKETIAGAKKEEVKEEKKTEIKEEKSKETKKEKLVVAKATKKEEVRKK